MPESTRVSAWHTHPNPGDTRPRMGEFSDGDKDFGGYYRVPVYLETPMGSTLVYDPAMGNIRRVR